LAAARNDATDRKRDKRISANYFFAKNYSFETEVGMRKISVLQTGGPDVLQLVA
jgi:hypothetical protein